MMRASSQHYARLEASFHFTVASALSPVEAWERIVDVSRHGDVVPFTRGRGPRPADLCVGDRVVARTGVGRVGFDDVMVVRELARGEMIVFEKVGRLLTGVVRVEVVPAGSAGESHGSEVAWQQNVRLPWLFVPAPLAPHAAALLAKTLRRGYQRVVRNLLR